MLKNVIVYFFLVSAFCFGRQSTTAANEEGLSSSGTLYCCGGPLAAAPKLDGCSVNPKGVDLAIERCSIHKIESEFRALSGGGYSNAVYRVVDHYFDCSAINESRLNNAHYPCGGLLGKSDSGSQSIATVVSEGLYSVNYILKITAQERLSTTFKLSNVC